MSEYPVTVEREPTGRYTDERILCTSITFAAAYMEEQVGVTVINSAEEVVRLISYWKTINAS